MAIAPRHDFVPHVEDLSGDPLLENLARIELHGRQVPVIGKIPLLSRLGRGAMGAVYYSVHPRLKIEVAIKILQANLAQQDPGLIDRFYREAQSAARVSSRHLVHVSDVDEEGGLFYIVMEFVSGLSAAQYLMEVISGGGIGLKESEALDIVIAATRGLAAAHLEHIIHRDVKPSNILVPRNKEGECFELELSKLADLGLARPEDQDGGLTGRYQTIGTPGYMAPEQIQDATTASKPADVFSMGATLYALLCGAPPFMAASQMLVLAKTLSDPHSPLESYRGDISLGTAGVIERCLSKEAERRYPDGSALLDALKKCRAAIESGARRSSNTRIDETTILSRRKKAVQSESQQTRHAVDVVLPPSEPRPALAAASTMSVAIPAPPVPPPAPVATPRLPERVPTVISEPGTFPGAPPPPPRQGSGLHTPWPFNTYEALRRRQESAANAGIPERLVVQLGGAELVLELIPPGEFLMGSPHTEEFRERDEISHYVQIARPYYIAKYPITQEQWQAVLGTNPSRFKDLPDSPIRPVERVSWLDVSQKFLPKLPAPSAGWMFRLPTEAEWEYACRAGTESTFYFGQSLSLSKLNCKEDNPTGTGWKWVFQAETAFHVEHQQTSAAGIHPPNTWGLYDMHGNVWEWCEDCYDPAFYHNQPAIDPLCTSPTEERIMRGGAWNYSARYCRSAYRYHCAPDTRHFSTGFRLVLAPVRASSEEA